MVAIIFLSTIDPSTFTFSGDDTFAKKFKIRSYKYIIVESSTSTGWCPKNALLEIFRKD